MCCYELMSALLYADPTIDNLHLDILTTNLPGLKRRVDRMLALGSLTLEDIAVVRDWIRQNESLQNVFDEWNDVLQQAETSLQVCTSGSDLCTLHSLISLGYCIYSTSCSCLSFHHVFSLVRTILLI